MKTMTILLGMALLPLMGEGQNDARPLPTKLSDVIVYTQGAQLTHKGALSIPKGTSVWEAKSLSPHLDAKSIQVSLKGDATILSVNHRLEYLNINRDENSLTSIQDMIERLKDTVAILNARSEVLNEVKSILALNKTFSSQNTSVNVAELQAAIRLHNDELQKIKNEELQITVERRRLRQREQTLQNQLNQLTSGRDKAESQITIQISAEVECKVELRLSYYTKQAGWFPKYDIRVDEISEPISLTYKAQVFQNTGEEWKDVLLTFTNAPASETGVAPKLDTWRLSYDRYTTIIKRNGLPGEISGYVRDQDGVPLIGASVNIQGTTIGTVTDMDGRYSLISTADAKFVDVHYTGYQPASVAVQGYSTDVVMNEGVALSEIIVADLGTRQEKYDLGYAVRSLAGTSAGTSSGSSYVPLPVSIVEKTTAVEFQIDRPYTIPSDGKSMSIDLKEVDIPAMFKYYAAPKLSEAAFLYAYIIQPDQYNLLAGEANIYFENTYVGRSVIDIRSFSDTLNISLGVDRNIEVDRIKVTDAVTRKFIGSNVTENRVFDTRVKNNKTVSIDMTILDQIPVSAINTVEVKSEVPEDAVLNSETGIVTWQLTIPSLGLYKTRLAYEVKYPRSEKVLLE